MGRHHGFSLLELLVVIVIIGLGIAIVGIGAGKHRPQELRAGAREFANLASLVAEEAVLTREPWGIQFYRVRADKNDEGSEQIGWRWLHFRNDRGGWEVSTPRELPDGGRFAEGVLARLEVEGAEQLIEPLPADKPPEPTLWLAPGGEVTPFSLRLYFAGGEAGAVVVRADALGRIQLDLENNNDEH